MRFDPIACCGFILLFSLSCSFRGSTARAPEESPTNGGSQESSEPKRSIDLLTTKFFEGNPKGAEAWQQFVGNGRYRLAQQEDFQFSDAAISRLRHVSGDSWRSRAFNAHTGGEINHDKFYHDGAYIVVDTTRNDSKKFGLVIFNEQPGEGPHQTHWLYEERDLSRTVFGWASSGLHLEEFSEEGEARVCYVNWNEARQRYSCDQTPNTISALRVRVELLKHFSFQLWRL